MNQYTELLELPPEILLEKLKNKMTAVPESFGEEDLSYARTMIGIACNNETFLSILLCYAKRNVRELKRHGTKEEYEDAVDKRDIIEILLKSLNNQHQTISRQSSFSMFIDEMSGKYLP